MSNSNQDLQISIKSISITREDDNFKIQCSSVFTFFPIATIRLVGDGPNLTRAFKDAKQLAWKRMPSGINCSYELKTPNHISFSLAFEGRGGSLYLENKLHELEIKEDPENSEKVLVNNVSLNLGEVYEGKSGSLDEIFAKNIPIISHYMSDKNLARLRNIITNRNAEHEQPQRKIIINPNDNYSIIDFPRIPTKEKITQLEQITYGLQFKEALLDLLSGIQNIVNINDLIDTTCLIDLSNVLRTVRSRGKRGDIEDNLFPVSIFLKTSYQRIKLLSKRKDSQKHIEHWLTNIFPEKMVCERIYIQSKEFIPLSKMSIEGLKKMEQEYRNILFSYANH